MTCPEHGEPYPCSHPVGEHWCLEDREDGWYVLSPWGGVCGPFTEEEGAAKMRELRMYPVWCPSCLVPMKQDARLVTVDFAVATWKCPTCQLQIDQSEVADIIRVNE